MALQRDNRNVLVLATSQALYMTGMSINAILTGLAGFMLASDKALATLPFTAVIIATMFTTVPASLLMKRIGRRPGFILGALIGIIGGLISAYGIYIREFWCLVAGTFVIGMFGGFAQYFRFAAADTARPEFKSKAISLVLAGGVIAAIAGPELAKWSNNLFEPILFLGAYVVISALALISAVLLFWLDIPKPSAEEIKSKGRPMLEIMRQPTFIVAVLCGMIGYSTMALVMTATPLFMQFCGYGISDTAFIIQWHSLGMFAPAFFTGHLIQRYGVLNIILIGIVLQASALIFAVSGINLYNFWFALVAVGVGWNFIFVGGTTLLTECYAPAERAKTQAVNDLMVFGFVAIASLLSGAILHLFNWNTVMAIAAPASLILGVAVIWLKAQRHRESLAAETS
jgi:predicted MFS family arabinose efflux permease